MLARIQYNVPQFVQTNATNERVRVVAEKLFNLLEKSVHHAVGTIREVGVLLVFSNGDPKGEADVIKRSDEVYHKRSHYI
eukprot:XP_001709569.1 Hypothetical protein GL50803_31404 [Giardia lamblia ATCC 50803]